MTMSFIALLMVCSEMREVTRWQSGHFFSRERYRMSGFHLQARGSQIDVDGFSNKILLLT